MTIAYAGTPTTAAAASGASITIGKPSGVTDGDLLVAIISSQSSTSSADFTCSGWSRIGTPFTASSATVRANGVYVKPVSSASAESATSYTFSATSGTGRIAGMIFRVTGADLSSPGGSAPSTGNGGVSGYTSTGNTTAGNITFPAATADSLMVLACDNQHTSGQNYTPSANPSGSTRRQLATSAAGSADPPTASITVAGLWTQNVASGATPATQTVTYPTNVSQIVLYGAYIKAKAVSTKRPVYYTDSVGHMTQAKGCYYTSDANGTLVEAAEMRPYPYGYGTAAAMLNGKTSSAPFYVAHRGGSADWPEMSLHAYTQAGYRGCGAFELSLARTSDGVFFGLHDQYLDRTALGNSGGTTLDPSTMTWAQVQQYIIKGSPTSNADMPYMRLEEILSIYTSHVIFVDPKVIANTYYDALITKLNAAPNASDRFVGKSYGVGTGNTWITKAKAAGYKTWGYYYDTDKDNIAANASNYDYIGMDYNASSDAWSKAMAPGKPVIGHICPTASAATTALNYGAIGLMCSGVAEIVPRTA